MGTFGTSTATWARLRPPHARLPPDRAVEVKPWGTPDGVPQDVSLGVALKEPVQLIRQITVSVFVALLLVSSLPLRTLEEPKRALRWLTDLTATEQSWSMFAPEVREHVQWLEVHVEYVEGHSEIWRLQDRRHLTAGLRGDRWRKYGEQLESGRCRLAERLAEDLLMAPGASSVRLAGISEYQVDARRDYRVLTTSVMGGNGKALHTGIAACD